VYASLNFIQPALINFAVNLHTVYMRQYQQEEQQEEEHDE